MFSPTKKGQQTHAEYAKNLLDYRLILEFNKLRDTPIPGVYVMPDKKDIRKWWGVVFVREGAYAKGIFKFYIDLKAYPTRSPAVFFTSRVFNPLVRPNTGELDLSVQFPRWDDSIHFVALVLAYVKTVFYTPEYWGERMRHRPFNAKAAEMLKTNRNLFYGECSKCVRLSRSRVYDNESGTSIAFTPPTYNHKLLLARVHKSGESQELRSANFDFTEWFSDGVNNMVASITERRNAKAASQGPGRVEEKILEDNDDNEEKQ